MSRRCLSGPMGGDAQIAARVAEGKIRAVFFFVDPLSAHPHDPDIQTVMRVCNVHAVPIATNVVGADLFLASPLLHSPKVALGLKSDRWKPNRSGSRIGGHEQWKEQDRMGPASR